MKKNKLPVLSLALMIVMASCKKNDVLPPNASSLKNSAVNNATTSEWKALNNWATSKGTNVTTYSSKITDSSITADVAKNGLVLSYFKNNNTIQSLPFLEKDKSSFAYYQISKGNLTFSIDNYSGSTVLTTNSFTYFVFTPEKLKSLESAGYSKSKLMQMNYNDIAGLLK